MISSVTFPRTIAALCAILPTAIFSLRWRNCLPFLGNMPTMLNHDQLSVWGIYTLYAREPFGMPLGAVLGLSFPFNGENEMLSRGSIPLFAVIFKILAKFSSYFGDFYYLVLAEILSVFVCSYLACRLLAIFRVYRFATWILCATLIGLCPALLYRSSSYYNLSLLVAYPPCFLAFAYAYLVALLRPSIKSAVGLSAVLVCGALIDYYVLFGLALAGITCSCFLAGSYILARSSKNERRLRNVIGALVVGCGVSVAVLLAFGNEGTLQLPRAKSPWEARYDQGWGYGGGFGGGFHSADLLAPVIAPALREGLGNWMKCGPTAILALAGSPLTTADLGPGQYEGFAYIGTVPTLIGLIVLCGLRFRVRGLVVRTLLGDSGRLAFSVVSLGCAAFVLFSVSWGYILHVGGHRLPWLMTPSLFLASVYPPFMLARALGRLAMPLSLFLIVAIMVLFERRLACSRWKFRSTTVMAICLLATSVHIAEVRGYLLPPSKITRGNQIVSAIGQEDAAKARKFAEGTNAILLLPDLRHGFEWGLLGYSLGLHTGVPLSGRTVTFGEPRYQLDVFGRDMSDVRAGKLSLLYDRYGPVTIAGKAATIANVQMLADVPVSRSDLSNDLALLRIKPGRL